MRPPIHVGHLLERPPSEVAEFEYGGLGIRVRTSRRSDLVWLSEFLLPAFEPTDTSNPVVEVRLHSDPDAFRAVRGAGSAGEDTPIFALDTRLAEAPAWSGGGSWSVVFAEAAPVFYLRSPDRSLFLVLAEHGRHSVRGAMMRALRELAMNAVGASEDALLLHGAAVSVEGAGVVILGRKQAGKTTTLVSLLRNDAADYVSNDRVVLRPDDGGVRLAGLPTYASVRDGTLALFPGVRRRLIEAGFHARFTVEEALARRESPRAMDDGRYSLSPAQLCHLADASAVGGTVTSAIVFLTPVVEPSAGRADQSTLAPLEPGVAAERIMSTRLGASYGATPSRFFVSPTNGGPAPRTGRGAPPTAAPGSQRRCEEVASRIPCFEWGALRGSPGLGLLDALSEHAAPAGVAVGDSP